VSAGTRAPVRSGTARKPPAPRRGPRQAAAPEPEVVPHRRRRVVLWALVVVIALAGIAAGLVYSPLLDVESVQVTGVAAARAAAVRDASGITVGDPILAVWPGRAAARVRDLPWVEDAKVVRDLPGSVRIDVVPRVPVGWTKAGARVLVVDGESRVIERLDTPPPGVPELTGVADLAPVGGEIAPRSLSAAAAELGAELRQRIATVALDDGAVTAQVTFGPQLRFGTPERLAAKARVVSAVLASLGATPVAYVDVSVPAAPVSG